MIASPISVLTDEARNKRTSLRSRANRIGIVEAGEERSEDSVRQLNEGMAARLYPHGGVSLNE